MIRVFAAICFAAMMLGGSSIAFGHSASTSYVVVTGEGSSVRVQWSLALRDLDDAIGLDRDGDGQVTWGEVRTQAGAIDAYALARLQVSAAGIACHPQGDVSHLIENLTDGAYVVLRYRLQCPTAADPLEFSYSALFEIDPQHRGLLSVLRNGTTHAALLSPQARHVAVDAPPNLAGTARSFFVTGVEHFLDGADHLLFIVVLLAPALLRIAGAQRPPTGSLVVRLLGVAGVLTAFTLGHGAALTLAVLGVVSIPAAVVEPAIALTIVATALDNLRPFLPGRRWMLALAFGLIHGLGVAGGLGPMLLPPLTLSVALLAFNLGLEVVQIAIVLLLAPIGRATRSMPAVAGRVGASLSVAAAIVAIVWFGQRFELPL